MYVSDYGFAADPSAWTTTLYNYNTNDILTKTWMYSYTSAWTITAYSYSTVFFVSGSGVICDYEGWEMGPFTPEVGESKCSGSFDQVVYPTFYLNSNVTYMSGIGTQEDPIIIN